MAQRTTRMRRVIRRLSTRRDGCQKRESAERSIMMVSTHVDNSLYRANVFIAVCACASTTDSPYYRHAAHRRHALKTSPSVPNSHQ